MSILITEVKTTVKMQGIYVRTKKGDLYFVTARDDPDPINPHDDFGVIELVTTNNRYFSGDIITSDPENELHIRDSLNQDYVALPLYLLAHGDSSISTRPFNDPWDSGQIGYAICTKENVVSTYGTDKNWQENGRKLIRQDIDTYDHYLRGETFVYDVYEYDPVTNSWEYFDGCSGFYSDDEEEMFEAFFRSSRAEIIPEEKARELYEL